jgi:hypothetical protein
VDFVFLLVYLNKDLQTALDSDGLEDVSTEATIRTGMSETGLEDALLLLTERKNCVMVVCFNVGALTSCVDVGVDVTAF